MPRNDPEHQQQSLLFSWAKLKETQIPELESLYAVPNGSNKSIAQAVKFKAEGLKSGVPDVVLPVLMWNEAGRPVPQDGSGPETFASCWFGGLYIEMKAPDKYPRPDQRAWADRLERQGMKVIRRCTTWQDAARHILEYLGIEVTRKRFPELFVT